MKQETGVPMRHYQVRDGGRTINFTGNLLASSSSRRRDSYRWVEFELYRTQAGAYVLGRTGVSNLFHDPGCAVVGRNGLKPGEPGLDAVPCDECQPSQSGDDYYCVETPRYWAQVSDSPDGVLEALYRVDETGTRFITWVARRLIERAVVNDDDLREAYSTEYVA